jgi:isopentenyl diphosphate isomerase/L-lactate dehydrogenase-like FMN-dependent dehydrogenase
MNTAEIKQTAKERFQGTCRVCRVCDGRACAGEMPGMGGTGTGSSFIANVEALAAIKLNLRTIHDASEPDIRFEFFGHELSMPVLAAPVAGVRLNMGGTMPEADFVMALIGGSKAAGSVGMTGDGPGKVVYSTGIDVIKASSGQGIPIIKPRLAEDIVSRIRQAEEVGAWAVGVDVDAAGIIGMVRARESVGPKIVEAWQEIIAVTDLPFILKGIMTVEDAEASVETGAAAIVVSNHGGRVLDHTPGTADVLPEIAEAVGGDVLVLVDGGVRSGADVLKMLALGAHAVLVGRPLAIAAMGGGAEGVAMVLDQYADQLRSAMILTGCGSLAEINESILW